MKCKKARELIAFSIEAEGNYEALGDRQAKVHQHLRECPECLKWLRGQEKTEMAKAAVVQQEHDRQIAARIGAVLDQITAFARDLEAEMHDGELCLGCRGKIVLAVGRSLGLAVPLLVPLPQEQADG